MVVGIGGTTRMDSSSERALRYTLGIAAAAGAETVLLGAADIHVPMYQPDAHNRTPAAERLVEALREADGVVVASPGYHCGVSGLVKNALDYAEDLRTDARPYLDGRAFGCIATAAGWQAPAATLGQLRTIAHALRAWPTPVGVAMNSAQPCFDTDGAPVEPFCTQLETMARQVVFFTRTHSANLAPMG